MAQQVFYMGQSVRPHDPRDNGTVCYKTSYLIQVSGSNYKANTCFINESGLYSLIFSSKLESARKFKRWGTSEVLPQIRKTVNKAVVVYG